MAVIAAACTVPPSDRPDATPSGVATPTRSAESAAGVPYTDNRKLEMTGPPPRAFVRGDDRTLDVIALDWTALGGSERVPSPPVRWQERSSTGEAAQVVLETSQLPIRVVAYAYGGVDDTGVPIENPDAEHRCGVNPGSWCSYASTAQTVITLPPQPAGTYLVVQAAWITAQGSDVQLSYAWRAAG